LSYTGVNVWACCRRRKTELQGVTRTRDLPARARRSTR